MKIIVFSDSHGSISGMCDTVVLSRPDRIIHLGDHFKDADALADHFPDIPVMNVKGNCDFGDCPDESLEIIGGKRFFLCHGHRYGVKSGYARLYLAALASGADAALCGHTHTPICVYSDGIYLINPGAMSNGGKRSYAVIEISSGDMLVNIVHLNKQM